MPGGQAEERHTGAVGRRRPFELSADWVLAKVGDDPRCDGADQWFEFSGTGHGPDVGACTMVAGHCTRVAQPPGCTSWYRGVWSITTEAGDTIDITFDGWWLEPGHAREGVDRMTVVGGTGRFEGATGEIEGVLYPDWSASPLRLRQTCRGWIALQC